MQLYKFRALSNLEFLLDILINERLYCAPHKELNDPFEGMYLNAYSYADMLGGIVDQSAPFHSDIAKAFGEEISSSTRVCSLSLAFHEPRMWSYYAEGHNGVAIGIDFDKLEKSKLYRVDYMAALPLWEAGELSRQRPEILLHTKTSQWDHESEYRIITDSTYHEITDAIFGVIFGVKVPPESIKLLRKIVPERIRFYRAELRPDSVSIMPILIDFSRREWRK